MTGSNEPPKRDWLHIFLLALPVVFALPTAMLAWRQYNDYPSPPIAAEKQKPAEHTAAAPPPAPQPVAAKPKTEPAPAPVAVPVEPAPPASAVAIAAVPDSPPAPQPEAMKSPLDEFCPSKTLPKNPDQLTSFKDQVCAIVACAGEALTDDHALPIVLDWQAQTKAVERQSCLFGDRAALTAAGLFKEIIAAVSKALDESSLPKDFEMKNTCRVVQDKLSATLMASRARLLPPDEMPRNCPASGQQVSTAVQEFMGRYQIR